MLIYAKSYHQLQKPLILISQQNSYSKITGHIKQTCLENIKNRNKQMRMNQPCLFILWSRREDRGVLQPFINLKNW